ncbi:MAG TPA: hypothetical protein VJU16_07295 [Planctomycetota bacterium]|nr:hypothetical protein [Planctomycetota bacterium]
MANYKQSPCSKGCGELVSDYPPVRSRHEAACEGKPKESAAAAEPREPRKFRAVNRGPRKPRKPNKDLADVAAQGDEEWLSMTKARATQLREEVKVMRQKADALEARAERLEEVVKEFGASF